MKTKIKTAQLKGGGIVTDDNSFAQHQLAANSALRKANQLLSSGHYDLLVCDEICSTLRDKLLTLKQVKQFLNLRHKTHLILTGRNAPPSLLNLADLVTEMKKIKHPYDLGIKAVKGLDF